MKAAVLGHPITHSLSPTLHNAGYAALGLEHDYVAIDIQEHEFMDFLGTLDSQWMGLSLTMPLKEIVLSATDQISDEARLAQSANTLIIGQQLVATNTDIQGIVQAFAEVDVVHVDTMAIIGSGATARSAVVAAGHLGVDELSIIARNQNSAKQCWQIAQDLGITARVMAPDDADFSWAQATVNTTPAFAMDTYANSIPEVAGPLLDVVYSPWPTALARRWDELGGRICPGYLMLLHQAAAQFALMTEKEAPLEAMRTALLAALPSK